MSETQQSVQAEGKPESNSTSPTTNQALISKSILSHPSKRPASSTTRDLNSQPATSAPDSPPPLPKRNPIFPGPRTKPPNRQTKLRTEPLPPPPPEPGLPRATEPITEGTSPVPDQSSKATEGTSGAMSTQQNEPGDNFKSGDSPPPRYEDTAKRISGNGEVQVEMDELHDPMAVDIVQSKIKGKKGDNGSLDGHKVQHCLGSEEEVEQFLSIPNEDDDGETTDFDELDLDDLDRKDDAWREANILSRAILMLQTAVVNSWRLLNRITRGNLKPLMFLTGFTVYFILAMTHKFGDEGSHRLLGGSVFGVVMILWPYVKRFIVWAAKRVYGSDSLSEQHTQILEKVRVVCRWLAYAVMIGVMIFVLVDEGRKRPKNLRGLIGIVGFLLVALLFSTRPSKVNWHTIFWSIALQFLCAMFVLKWKHGRDTILWVQDRFNEFFDNSHEGNLLLFGEKWRDHLFIFGALPLLWFANGVFTMLYYVGAMQFIIGSVGNFLQFVTGVSPLEAMSISAGIFMEGYTNLVVMRPFLGSMTKSQLFSVVTGCISSLGGAYLAFLGTLGISFEYVIPAMLVSAPATFAICKLMVPEARDDECEILHGDCKNLCDNEKGKYASLLDACQSGALAMLSVTANVAVVGYVFMTLISWFNHTLGWLGDRVGADDISIEWLLSYLLYPVALAMGVDIDDCRRVGMLLGFRTGLYNLIAFIKLTQLKVNKYVYFEYMTATNFTGTITHHSNDDITLDLWGKRLEQGFLSDRSEAIATYSLCGFSSIISSVMVLGVIYALVPKRKQWITSITIPALVAGNLANCMTGCFASLFY